MYFQADVGNDLEGAVKSLLTRVTDLETQNQLFKQENGRVSKSLNDLQLNNVRLSDAKIAQNERLTRQNDDHQRDIKQLTKENERQNDEHQQEVERLFRANAALEQRVERLEAINSRQTAARKPSPEPDIRSQFTAFACTLGNVTIACPNNRTIVMTSAVYGLFDSPNSECSGCCAPNPQYDCTELVEENSPADWLAIQALCDGQELCQFETPGTALGDCSSQLSDYMQLFYDCVLDDETGPVAFTAWADTGNPTSYNDGDIIVFDQVLTNAGGHYNAGTSSFICPWDGL